MYRAPLTVSRRIYLQRDTNLQELLLRLANELLVTDTADRAVINAARLSWLLKQKHNSSSGDSYLDVAMIGSVKLLREYVLLPKDLKGFLMHEIRLEEMQKQGVTKQHLQDIADIFVLDYLNLNIDRRDSKNWVKSETRLIAFDNGLSFSHMHDDDATVICPPMLRCPAFICGTEHPYCTAFKPLVNCRFHAQTIYSLTHMAPQNKTGVISFISKATQRDLYQKLDLKDEYMDHEKTQYRTLGERLRYVLGQELIPQNYERYFGRFDLFRGIDARVAYLLRHVDDCHSRYGKSVFI